MARQSLKSQLESLLGKKRRGVTVKWRPTHRGIIDTSNREIRRGLGRGLKDDVHGYVFWDVATEDFDSDFAPPGEFVQLSNRDYRILGMIYEAPLDKTTDGREEWFVMGTSPRAIRALADEVGGTAFSIEAIEDNTKPQKKTPAETKARDKAEALFKKKLEKLGYTVRISHLRGRTVTVKGGSAPYRRFDGLDGIFLAAWETDLFRFYTVTKGEDDEGSIKVTLKESRPIPPKRFRVEKIGLAEALEAGEATRGRMGDPHLRKVLDGIWVNIKPREDHHYR